MENLTMKEKLLPILSHKKVDMKKEIIGFYKSLVSFTEADEDEFRRLKELKDKNEIMKIFKKW